MSPSVAAAPRQAAFAPLRVRVFAGEAVSLGPRERGGLRQRLLPCVPWVSALSGRAASSLRGPIRTTFGKHIWYDERQARQQGTVTPDPCANRNVAHRWRLQRSVLRGVGTKTRLS